MENRLIDAQVRDGCWTLALTGRDAKGMVGTALLRELVADLETIAQDAEARAVVLTGAGDIFCTGGNVGQGPGVKGAFADAFIAAIRALDRLTVPLLVAVNGKCTAGGMTLLGCGDYAITVESARFGYTELAVGAFPSLALVTVPAHLPKKVFFELAYTSKLFTPAEMRNLHLVNEVVPDGELDAAVGRFLELVLGRSASAMARGRALYYATQAPTPIHNLEIARSVVMRSGSLDYYK